MYICIDSPAAIDTLKNNSHNHEFARHATTNHSQLRLLGWELHSVVPLPPRNPRKRTRRPPRKTRRRTASNISSRQGNQGLAPGPGPSPTPTTMENRATALPPILYIPRTPPRSRLGRLWRTLCNRSPSDAHPNTPADLCPCGQELASAHHYLRDCPLLDTRRSRLRLSSTGDIQEPSFMTPSNFRPLRDFLRTTGLGHSATFCFDNISNSISSDAIDSDSPEPDFAFEP